jgi:hypothetical protein
MKRLLALALLVASPFAVASCPNPAFTDPSRVGPAGDSVMIVTHPTAKYDGRLASRHGVDEAIRFAKLRRIPLIFLADNGVASAEHYFVSDCSPDYWVYSEDGEVRFEVRATHLYVVGGHLEVCLSNTLLDVLQQWARQPKQDRSITYFMDGIYSYGRDIGQSDPYYKDYVGFMNVVTYGRPRGPEWPKLTLLETMGLIANQRRQYDYLQRTLPFYQKLLPADYRVEVHLNGYAAKALQAGRGARPPVLRFNFIDSALASAQTSQPGSAGD